MRMELSGYAGPRTGELVVGQEFVNNILRKIYRADGTCAFLTVEGRIDHVSDIDGRITVDYRYDDEGGLSGITFCGARRDLERSVIDAENKVEEERARSLAALAEQRGMVIGQINNQVAPDLNSLISQRDSLRAQWNSLNSQDVGWWDPFGTARREKSRRLDELGGVICGVEQALSQIYAQLSSAYAQVDAEVAAAGRISATTPARPRI